MTDNPKSNFLKTSKLYFLISERKDAPFKLNKTQQQRLRKNTFADKASA